MIFPALGVNRKVVDIDEIYLNMQNEQVFAQHAKNLDFGPFWA